MCGTLYSVVFWKCCYRLACEVSCLYAMFLSVYYRLWAMCVLCLFLPLCLFCCLLTCIATLSYLLWVYLFHHHHHRSLQKCVCLVFVFIYMCLECLCFPLSKLFSIISLFPYYFMFVDSHVLTFSFLAYTWCVYVAAF